MMSSLLLVLALASQDVDGFPTPVLTRIEVARDTVWFFGARAGDTAHLAYGHVRRTGEWFRAPRVTQPLPPALLPADTTDAVHVTQDWDLVRLTVPEDDEDPFAAFALRARQTGARGAAPAIVPLRLELSLDDRRRLTPESAYDPGVEAEDSLLARPATTISSWLRRGDTLWFGLAGGFSEGIGGLGGVLAFDVRARRLEAMTSPLLAVSTVSALALSGDSLWIGTGHRGEYGAFGRVGLLRYGLRDRAWQRYTSDSTPLPGNLITALAADGDRLYVATDRGLAALDTRTGAWDVRWFGAVLRGSDFAHDLVAQPTHADTVRNSLWASMLALGIERRAEYLGTAAAIPIEEFLALPDEQGTTVYVHRALVPYYIASLGRGGLPRLLAAQALATVGDTSAVPALRALLRQGRRESADIAVALARLGDLEGREWIRIRLANPVSFTDTAEAARAAGQLRDEASVPLLVALLRSEPVRVDAFFALAAFERADLWRTLAQTAAGVPELWRTFVQRATWDDSTVVLLDAESRAALASVARRLLATSDTLQAFDRAPAALAVALVGDTVGVPYLIALLTQSEDDYRAGVSALVRMTGLDDAPAPVHATLAQRVHAQRFFASWWLSHAKHFTPLPIPEGAEAERRWRARWGEPET